MEYKVALLALTNRLAWFINSELPPIRTTIMRKNSNDLGWISDLRTLRKEAPALLPLARDNPAIIIVTPSNSSYSCIRKEYNEHNRAKEPLAIILPRNNQDLKTAVKFCTSRDVQLPLTIRGGGHDPYGRTIAPTAVQLDLRLLKWIEVFDLKDSLILNQKGVALGPGLTAMEVQRELDGVNLNVATGWVGSVGMIGWSCGGGYGLSSGLWGLGVDNILGAKVMQASGEIIDTQNDEDLLWAMRGTGQGNFGIVIELRIKAHTKPRYLAGFQGLADRGMPDNFGGELTINTTDDLGPTINIFFTWICRDSSDESLKNGERFKHEFIKNLQVAPSVDTVAETSILAFHTTLSDGIDESQHGYWEMASVALPRLTPEVIDVVMRAPAPAGGRSAILVHYAHGQATRDDTITSWNHRRQHYIFSPCAIAPLDASVEEMQATKQWTRTIHDGLLKTGQTLLKGYWSMSRPEDCDANRFYGQETVKRLAMLKRKLDPSNAFPCGLPRLDREMKATERAYL
ncbi:hypothetical protein NLG97_g1701 [Lecanicillium saksenae]|uniref:Uncharacterized protein n=1 Tax=Lecanicillium saksenae TaxID=468837 RepID=A0ACC1R494_9HYPO|nr:hypothetical protein NLG97_g1701 [Lecanicillium saksenae]